MLQKRPGPSRDSVSANGVRHKSIRTVLVQRACAPLGQSSSLLSAKKPGFQRFLEGPLSNVIKPWGIDFNGRPVRATALTLSRSSHVLKRAQSQLWRSHRTHLNHCQVYSLNCGGVGQSVEDNLQFYSSGTLSTGGQVY